MSTKSSPHARAKRTPQPRESKSESEVEMEEKSGEERVNESTKGDDIETERRERTRKRDAAVDGDAQMRESSRLWASGRKYPSKKSRKY